MNNFNINTINIEEKTDEHYSFLTSYFNNLYIKSDDFFQRDDLSVISLRNDDGVLIAVSLFRLGFTPTTKTPVVRIMVVLVDEKYRGNNINIELIKTLKKYCISFGCRKMICNIRETNTASIKSFTNSGFTIKLTREPKYYKDNTLKVTMVYNF